MPQFSPYPNENADDFYGRMTKQTMGKKSGMVRAANRFMLTQAQKKQKENKETEKY